MAISHIANERHRIDAALFFDVFFCGLYSVFSEKIIKFAEDNRGYTCRVKVSCGHETVITVNKTVMRVCVCNDNMCNFGLIRHFE